MPRIRVECELPFQLALDDGAYADRSSDALHWSEGETPNSDETGGTRVWSYFTSDAAPGLEIENERAKQARKLIQKVNRLIRWYRVISSDHSAGEVTLWKASPFRFFVDATNAAWGGLLIVEKPSIPSGFFRFAAKFPEFSEQIRNSFATGAEPPVSDLFLADARQSLNEGRFREAVLFSWSTIDATFSSRFEDMVDKVLADEWSESRKFLKGVDFGMKHRMAIGMRLVSGRSFFREPGDFWQRLSVSYDRRNAIIHRGDIATEADAENAISVAENVVRVMNEVSATSGSAL